MNEVKDLFVSGEFESHSGIPLQFKIDCDALSDASLEALAKEFVAVFPIREVYAIPSGGTRFARALEKHVTSNGSVLIVDDVLTTGRSMEEKRAEVGGDPMGVVIFLRGPRCPSWIQPFFTLDPTFIDPR